MKKLSYKKGELPSEHEIQQAVSGYLQYKGFFVMRLNSGKIPQTDRYGRTRLISLAPPGTPDLLGLKHGKAYFFEIKKPQGIVTMLQEAKIAELRSFGAICHIIHSVDELEALKL